jgi:hypothetical protein
VIAISFEEYADAADEPGFRAPTDSERSAIVERPLADTNSNRRSARQQWADAISRKQFD